MVTICASISWLAANRVALVSQNVHLFNDTVANNIAYARTEQYSREQIEEAARMALRHGFHQQDG